MRLRLAAVTAAVAGIATGLYLTWGVQAASACCYWRLVGHK